MQQRGATSAIFKRWIDMWDVETALLTPPLSVPYSLDNMKVPEPVDGLLARVGLLSLDSQIYTLGPKGSQQRPGYIDVRITDEPNRGRGRADDLCEVVRKIYERKRFASDGGANEYGIVTHATSVSELRRDRDAPQLWVVQLLTPFEFYS